MKTKSYTGSCAADLLPNRKCRDMNTLDILIYICEKREEFVVNGLNAQDALTKATHAIANEYHICSESITKLVSQ
jgi:hypothetical protein